MSYCVYLARMFGLEKFVTIVWMTEEFQSNNHHAPPKNCKKSITNLQLYKASGLQSTNLFGLKNDHNLQVFTPFHLKSTAKFWPKSTIYIKATPPPPPMGVIFPILSKEFNSIQ